MRKVVPVGLLLCGIAFCAEAPRGIRASAPRSLIDGTYQAGSSLPFRAVGIYWQGVPAASVRVRASSDGRTWTSWIASRGESVDGQRTGSGLIYFEGVYRYAQVGGVPDPEILFIDPGVPRGNKAPSRKAVAVPSIVSREEWGCTPQTCPAQDPPLYTAVTHLVVHHTDGANTATDWNAVLRSIWVLHVMGNGWNDIGYNYLIDPNGVLYEGRAGGDGVLGAHFSSVNSGTMGVALLGTFVDVPPPPKMLDTLSAMLAWQAEKWRVDPSGESLHAASGLMLNVVSGHRDAGISPKASGTTDCPGNAAYAWLPRIRQEVSARLSGDCPVEVGERNRCVSAAGGSLTIPVQTPAGCSWSATSGPAWITEVTNDAGVRVDVAPNLASHRAAALSIGGHTVTISQAAQGEQDLPCVGMRGMVSAANFDDRPVVAGSQISVFGDHLAGSDPLQTVALVNGKTAPVEFAGSGQVNIQLPPGTPTGTAHLRLSVNGVQGPETNFWVTEAVPSIFTSDGTRAIAANDDGSLNGPDQPVQSGHALTVYLTGAGAVDRAFPAGGTATPLSPLFSAKLDWSATVGGNPAGKLFLGLAPLLIGVYQANIIVPSGLASGEYPLVLTVSGVSSREALVSVVQAPAS